jgi:hypothetical protein
VSAAKATRLGTVVMDEQVYVITRIRLHGGLLHFQGPAPGPIDFPGGLTEYSIHGDDGLLIGSVRDVPMGPLHVHQGLFAHGDFTMRIGELRAVAE